MGTRLTRLIRSAFRDSAGNASVAFALALPLVVTMFAAVFDFGRAVCLDSTLSHAAREGARYAGACGAESMTPATVTDIAAVVTGEAVGAPAADLAISVIWAPDNTSGWVVTVTVGYTYTPLFANFLSIGPLQLEAESTMTVL
jgi:Flp pilus assembly protein TadG